MEKKMREKFASLDGAHLVTATCWDCSYHFMDYISGTFKIDEPFDFVKFVSGGYGCPKCGGHKNSFKFSPGNRSPFVSPEEESTP